MPLPQRRPFSERTRLGAPRACCIIYSLTQTLMPATSLIPLKNLSSEFQSDVNVSIYVSLPYIVLYIYNSHMCLYIIIFHRYYRYIYIYTLYIIDIVDYNVFIWLCIEDRYIIRYCVLFLCGFPWAPWCIRDSIFLIVDRPLTQ